MSDPEISAIVLPDDPGTLGGFVKALIQMLAKHPEMGEMPLLCAKPDGSLGYIEGFRIDHMMSNHDSPAVYIDFTVVNEAFHPTGSETVQ